MTGFSMSRFNSTCAEIFNSIREIEKSLARQDIQQGLVPWFDEFTGETTEEGLKNGISLDTVVPHGDTHKSTDHDVANVFVDFAAQHGSVDTCPPNPRSDKQPILSNPPPFSQGVGVKVESASASAEIVSKIDEAAESGDDDYDLDVHLHFNLNMDDVVDFTQPEEEIWSETSLGGFAIVAVTDTEVTSNRFSVDFSSDSVLDDARIGEGSFDTKFCVLKYSLSSCLQPVCENVKTSLPVFLPTPWNLFTSECAFFCCKKVKFDYMKSGKPPPLPPDITKYFIIYKGIFTEVCDGINWRCALADFIIIWSFNIQFSHIDTKLWSLKLMIFVHYNRVKKQYASKTISSIVLIKLGALVKVCRCISAKNFMGIVTADFNGSRHKITKNEGMIVGLTVVITNDPTTSVIVYEVNKKAKGLGGGSVPLLHIEECIIEVNDTAHDIHIDMEDYDRKMINHFYPEWGAYNIIENLKVQRHITDFDRANKYIASTTQTTFGVDTVTGIHSVVIAVYTWPKNYGDPSKRKDLSTLIRGAATSISSDEKVVLHEVAQSLFEGSFYTFEHLQMVLSPIDKEIPCLTKFMLASIMGGSLVSRLTAHSATQVKCLVNIIILLFGDLSHGKPATIRHIVFLLEIVEVLDMYHHSRFWVPLNFGSSVKARVDLCEGSGYLKWIRSIVLGLQVWLNQENVKGLLVSYFQSIHNIMESTSYKFPSKIKQQSSFHIWNLLINLCGHFSPLITKFGSEKMVSLSAMLVASSLTTSGSKTITNLSSVDSIPSTLFGGRLSNAQHKVRSTKINTTSTDMYFNHDSLAVQRMQAGDSKLADLGGVTLDPKRWNVVLHSEDKSSTIAADGLTTVQEALLENSGAKLARKSAAETNNLAGNVTIAFVILVEGLTTDGVDVVAISVNPVLIVRRIELMTKALVAKRGLIFKKVDSGLADVAAVSASNKYIVGNMIEEVLPMVGCKGVLTLAFSMHCTKKFVMFSLPRPPEIANLEDKVDFKGVGMIHAWKVT